MTGHIRRRGARSWELKFDDGRDPTTRKRVIRYHSFKGTKREAEKKLVELLSAVGTGSYVEPSKLTLAEHVRVRVDQWQASGDITARTAERYRELVENQIAPHIGTILLQKLKDVDIEKWHTTLRAEGRKDRAGGVSARTIGHAHRVLSKALKEAAKRDLVTRNVAASEPPPKVEAEEMIILTADQVREAIAKLRGRAIYPAAITDLFTGLRRGELLALRWRHVELDASPPLLRVREALEETKGKAGGIRFKKTKTSNGRRDVTLPGIVVAALAGLGG